MTPVEPSAAAHTQEPDTRALVQALVRVGTIVGLGVLPIAAIVLMFAIGTPDGSLSTDFHGELYPEAKLLLQGENPFPSPDFDPLAQANLIWPPVASFLVAPLTLLPAGVADVVMAGIGLVCFALAIWLVGVRDWRVYGALALWPQVVGEMRVSHMTPIVMVLVAAAWRFRDARGAPGPLIGLAVAVKLFVWPVALWLAATRRLRDTLLAVVVVGLSLLLVLPYTGLGDYMRSLLQLGRAFDQDSYTVYGLLVHAGASDGVARAATFALGLGLLAGTWRYRSFTLAVAAALVLSPVVWLDYFALAALPLAIARPRLSAIWFLPLLTWGAQGAGIGIGDVSTNLRVLGVFAVVFAVAFRADRSRAPEPAVAST